MKNILLKKLFSSGLQAIAVQVLGALFFYIASVYLSKEEFGIISWANAYPFMITALLGFGLDNIVARRVAVSRNNTWPAAAYLIHAFGGSVLAFLVLAVLGFFYADQVKAFQYLPWFFMAQALIYIGQPLKQLLNARQNFTPYGIIAVASNAVKLVLAYMLATHDSLSVTTVYLILIGCAAFELVALMIYVLKTTTFSFYFKAKAYYKLLKEAAPQYIATIFDSSLSRMDYILLAALATNTITAEYSFAYRIFELARLPIAIAGPVLLAKFAPIMSGTNRLDGEKKQFIFQLSSVEAFLAMAIPLLLNIIWIPLMDLATQGKYGFSNSREFMVLSSCIPFLFFVNLFWTLSFTNKRYKQTTYITIISAVLNVVLNLILIPYFGALGAALAYLTTTVMQFVGYYILIRKYIMDFSMVPFLSFLFIAAAVYFISTSFISGVFLQLAVAIILYVSLSLASRQINGQHLQTLKAALKR